jgi:hypothetical protein
MGSLPARSTAPIASIAAAAAIATATTTAAAATTTTTATETTRALRALFGFVDAEGAPVEHRAVHGCDGFGCLGVVAHGHECESARLPSLAVEDDMNVGHRAVLRKGFTDGFGG